MTVFWYLVVGYLYSAGARVLEGLYYAVRLSRTIDRLDVSRAAFDEFVAVYNLRWLTPWRALKPAYEAARMRIAVEYICAALPVESTPNGDGTYTHSLKTAQQ